MVRRRGVLVRDLFVAKSMKLFFYYIRKFIRFIQVQPIVGGLEISDSAVRFARFNGREWQMVSLRLPPGVVQGGRLTDYGQLAQVLKRLREQIPGLKTKKEKVSVVISLGSLSIYSQVISLPELEEGKLGESVMLNTQMVSPVDMAEVYSDWQVVGKNVAEHKLEVLSAFVQKGIVDEFSRAVKEGGFLAVALESKALALTRLIRRQGLGIDETKSYIVLSLDNEILDFLIMRRGEMYFEYLNYWKDIRGDARVISLLDFRNSISGSFRQVLNFYSQHWSEPIGGVILATPGLEEEVRKIIVDGFSLPVTALKLKLDKPVDPEWFGALGSGIRGSMPREEDRDISLLGVTARDEFRAQQVIGFLRFWRVLIPVALSFLVLAFLGGNILLTKKRERMIANAPSFSPAEMAEVEALQNEARNFNSSVDAVDGVRREEKFRTPVFQRIYSLISANNIVLERLGMRESSNQLSLSGTAKSDSDILDFKRALEADKHFSDVKLPLTEIRQSPQGFAFSVSFSAVTAPVN